MKDGTRLEDITGRVVKITDAEVVYNLMTEINRRAKNEKSRKDN
jgi:hypothetical protein